MTSQARRSLAVLIAVLLIPILLAMPDSTAFAATCRHPIAAPFEILTEPGVGVVVTGSSRVEPGVETGCGPVRASIAVRPDAARILVTVSIFNGGVGRWRGSVRMAIGDVSFPLDVGPVPAGAERSVTLSFSPSPGVTSLDGVLVVGP